jgi:hypothetical protein
MPAEDARGCDNYLQLYHFDPIKLLDKVIHRLSLTVKV